MAFPINTNAAVAARIAVHATPTALGAFLAVLFSLPFTPHFRHITPCTFYIIHNTLHSTHNTLHTLHST